MLYRRSLLQIQKLVYDVRSGWDGADLVVICTSSYVFDAIHCAFVYANVSKSVHGHKEIEEWKPPLQEMYA